MNLANLPGVGKVADPQPEHYRKAIAYLDARESKYPFNYQAGRQRDQLAETLRRIEWQRAGRQAQPEKRLEHLRHPAVPR